MSYDTLDNAATTDGGDHEGKLLAQRYKIVRKLGEGGMGMVYLAVDTELGDHPVAIKFIPPMLAGNARAVKNLKREALTSRQLGHPHIVRLHDLHTDGHQKFLVMEYIEGQTLDDVLGDTESERLPLERVLDIIEQLAAGLDYAHSQQVLHRDLKPSNIMVGKDGTVKLLDFGIAREMKDSYTRVTGNLTSGTLPYMSPEQLMGENPTVAMDVYSLGAVAYECLAGHPPFYMGDIRRQIEVKTPEPIDGVSPEVNQVLLRVLDKRSAHRPASAGALARALQAPESKPETVEPPAQPLDREPEAILPPATEASPVAQANSVVMTPPAPSEAPIHPEARPAPDAKKPRKQRIAIAVTVMLLVILGGGITAIMLISQRLTATDQAVCESELSGFATAWTLYQVERGRVPGKLEDLDSYILDTGRFSQVVYRAADLYRGALPDPALILAYDNYAKHGGTLFHVIFVDGRVETCNNENQLQGLIERDNDARAQHKIHDKPIWE